MNLLYLVIVIPLLSFLLLASFGKHWRKEHIIVIGVGTITIIAVLTLFVCIDYGANTAKDTSLIYSRFLWEWFSVDGFSIPITLSLDNIALVFLAGIAYLGLLIYLFAAYYLKEERDIYNFFTYGNLLLASMLIVILADNLFVMLIGWEGISLSIYLLICLCHRQVKISLAAIKAFIVMYVADIFFVIGLFLLYSELDTLNIRAVLTLAASNLAIDSEIVFWITLMLFIGVIGKTVQFPFHQWFNETSTVSIPLQALMQSSTVVFAGIYLLLRLDSLFAMSTDILNVINVIAVMTIIFASCSALVKNDIKNIITYINLSQISYILLAFSIQTWDLILTYVLCFAVTTALLLLSSAVLIRACRGERDINKMGGLYKKYPLLYASFLFAAASLSIIPWLTASFYTKGDIIWGLIAKGQLGIGTFSLIGVLLSTLGIFRIIFYVFHNKQKSTLKMQPIARLNYLPLAILAFLSTALFVSSPELTQSIHLPIKAFDTDGQFAFQILLASVTILGIFISYLFYASQHEEISDIANAPLGKFLVRLWYSDWRFDWLLHKVFVLPYLAITQRLQKDPLAHWEFFVGIGIKRINQLFAVLENGQLRWYIMSLVGGAVLLLLLLIFV